MTTGARCEVRGARRDPSRFLEARSSKLATGFTLIELLVVCAIIVVVTAVVLANNNRYGGEVLLQNFAYDVALSIRQAQVSGTAVQGSACATHFSGATQFSAEYGMHFDMNTPTVSVLFADCNGDGVYNSASDVIPQGGSFSITRGYTIVELCSPAGTDASCSGGSKVNMLDILFVNPEPDAYIAVNGTPCFETSHPCKPSARVVLESPRGDKMSVVVTSNGQIAVDQLTTMQP